MPREPRSVKLLLQSSAALRQLGNRIAEQQSLLDRIRQQLPSDLAKHCQAAVRDADQLALYTDSPAWASRLRYLGPALTSQLRADRRAIRKIRVRVLAIGSQGLPSTPVRKAKRLSEENRRMLLEVADGFPEPGLRAALRRLAGEGGHSRD
mgnify:CR=1 FL=1